MPLMPAALLLASATFVGSWQVERVDRAPWASGLPDDAWTNSAVVFRTNRVVARAPLGCGHAEYVRSDVPPDLLFQGGLGPAAVERARELAIPDPSPTLIVSCDTGVFEYHAAGDRLVIALDDDLIWLRRTPVRRTRTGSRQSGPPFRPQSPPGRTAGP